MERRYENLLKAVLLFKLCLWALIALTRFGLGHLIFKRRTVVPVNTDDPYLAQDGQSEDILALRYL